MTKLTKQGNFRVIVQPYEPEYVKSEEALRHRCDKIIKDICRHVDNISNVHWESDTLCTFCGSIWEVQEYDSDDTPKGMPLCCDDAAEEWKRVTP